MLEIGKYYLEEGTKKGDAGFKPWPCGILFFFTLKPRIKISVFSEGIGGIKYFIKLIQNESRQKNPTNANQEPEKEIQFFGQKNGQI